MKDILTAPFLTELLRTVSAMYAHGWDERNGGNISVLLDESELAPYLNLSDVKRVLPTGFDSPELAGKYFLVTGTGTYFRNIPLAPERDLGILRISADGKNAELLWGYCEGGKFTSEFASHMMSHAERLKIDPAHRVVTHCHPTNLLAMTFVHSLDERDFTRTLWRMGIEGLVVFPDGVGVLPWMVCGTNEIGMATAEKMQRSRIVIWSQHGIYGAGRTLDEAFGLIETADKAAEVYLRIAGLPIVNMTTDAQLRALAESLHSRIREGYLD